MQKPDKWMRSLPLEIAVAVADQFRKIILFHPDLIWANIKRQYCICRGNANNQMLGCEGCNEWYHPACIVLKAEGRQGAVKDKKWRCGFCSDKPSVKGIQEWKGFVSVALQKSKKAILSRPIDQSPLKLGRRLEDPDEDPQVVPSWDQLVEETRDGGRKIRAEEKVRKGKAERAVKRGGHHVVDERGNGGVQPRKVDGALIDELHERGELSSGDEDHSSVSEASDDE
jgi:PHD-finger